MVRVGLAALFVCSLILAAAVPRTATADPEDFSTRALEHVASTYGISIDELHIGETADAQFPLTGVALMSYKVIALDGRSFGVSFDIGNLEMVDPDVVAEQERQTRLDVHGALDASLTDLPQRNAAERIPVAIWVAMEDAGELARGSNPNYEAFRELVRAAQDPVVEEAQGQGIGAQLARADLVPVIFADLTPGQINGLSHHPKIVLIEAIPQDIGLLNDDSGTSDRFKFIWSNATGSGARVAVHEDDGVDDVTTQLIDPVYWCTGVGTGPGGAACTVGKNIGGHATNVAGVIASTNQWRRGGAFGLTAGSLLSANFQSFAGTGDPQSTNAQKIVNSATWALNQGADIVNMSWGGCSSGAPNFYSRWVDFLVKSFGDSIIVSSGNNNCGSPDFVGSPSLGWNTISVGSYYDNDTGLRSDDVYSSFSSYKNWTDPNSGRTVEKPDVTGMGGQVDGSGCHGSETTAIGSGFDSTCGTSFAAPDTSAVAALVVGKQPGLVNAGEAVKAVVMAGATHNIVDGKNYRDCPTSPVANDCRDGAGAVDAFQTIQNVVIPGNWDFSGLISPTSAYWDANGNHNIPVTIGANKNIRVVVAWDSTATCTNLGTGSQACATDVLNADLDLLLLNPGGNVVASSSSFQNSAEVIDFKTTVSGTYTLRVNRFRFDANTSTYVGLAWNLNTVDNKNPLTGVVNFSAGTTKNNQTTDKGSSFWDIYLDPAAGDPTGCEGFLNGSTGLEKVYKITTNSNRNITAQLTNIVGYPGVNSDIDVIILKKTGAANSQNTRLVTCGDTTATAFSQPAGTYLIVIDGFAGSVAKYSLKVSTSAPTAPTSQTPPEPLPSR